MVKSTHRSILAQAGSIAGGDLDFETKSKSRLLKLTGDCTHGNSAC